MVIGAAAVGAVTAGAGTGAGLDAAGAQASKRLGPTSRQAARRVIGRVRFMRSIPCATPLGSRDLTESRRPISRVLSAPLCEPATRERTPTPDGHSSRRAVTHTLQQPTRDSTFCNVLARRVISRRLFGLAPTGVYRATFVTEGAVGSYPTLSPLPHDRFPDSTAVCFLLHCPSHEAHAACAQALPGSLPCGARTFLGA